MHLIIEACNWELWVRRLMNPIMPHDRCSELLVWCYFVTAFVNLRISKCRKRSGVQAGTIFSVASHSLAHFLYVPHFKGHQLPPVLACIHPGYPGKGQRRLARNILLLHHHLILEMLLCNTGCSGEVQQESVSEMIISTVQKLFVYNIYSFSRYEHGLIFESPYH